MSKYDGGFGDNSQKPNEDGHLKYRDLITPLFIGQVIEAVKAKGKGDSVSIDGKEIDDIKIVARFLSKEIDKNNIKLKVEDSTGTLEVIIIKRYDHDTPPMLKNIELRLNEYYTIYFKMKEYNGMLYMVNSISEAKSFSHVVNHILQVCISQQHRLKGNLKVENNPEEKATNKSKEVTNGFETDTSQENFLKVVKMIFEPLSDKVMSAEELKRKLLKRFKEENLVEKYLADIEEQGEIYKKGNEYELL